jgi:predicted dehydrogenase
MTATVLTMIATPAGPPVQTIFHGSTMTRGHETSYLDVHGTKGSLHLVDFPWHTKLQLGLPGEDWLEQSVTAHHSDPVQQGWDRLVADFVEGIRGSRQPTYPTFEEGLVTNELIDAVRSQATYVRVRT